MAREVFAIWTGPAQSVSWQEHATLYVALDEVQPITLHFHQSSTEGKHLARYRCAAKLPSDTTWGRSYLVGALIKAEGFIEAGNTLKIARQLDPGRWESYTYRGLLAAKTGDLDGVGYARSHPA
jgi:hypothetical protein